MPDPSAIQSPRAAAFSQQPDPSDEEGLFVQGFSDLAYKALGKSQPGLMQDVITFRVLEKDIQNGEAVGTFIVKHSGEMLFIPIVLVDNNVKPLDLFYSRSRDRYFPLTAEWLREASTASVSRLGLSVDPPKNLSTDVDIRSLVVPPITGRYSYASDEAWLPFSQLRRELPSHGPAFLKGLSRLPDLTKTAVARGLAKLPKVASILVEQYGVSSLKDALAPRQAKVAATEAPMKHDVFLATASTPLQEMHRELGPDETAHAYSRIRKHGFYIADRREKHNELTGLSETTLKLEEPKASGLYRVYMTDGKARTVLVVPDPKSIHRDDGDAGRRLIWARRKEDMFLVLFPDGKYAMVTQLLAEPIDASQDDVDAFIERRAKPAPTETGYGVLISRNHLSTVATRPERAREITTSGGRTTFKLSGCHTVSKVKGRLGSMVKPQGQDAIMIGDDYVWWPCDDAYMMESDFLMDSRQIWALIESGAEKTGSLRVIARMNMEGNYLLGHNRVEAKPLQAVVKLASAYGISIADATSVLSGVKNRAPISFWVKKAEGEAPPQGADPNAPPPGPQGPGVPQAPPPPPTGLDLAIAEQMQAIQSQINALQQQAQTLSAVQQRAQGIDAGGGAAASPQGMTASMGMPPVQVMGAPPMAPPQGAPQGAPQGDPSQGMPPQGDPSQGMPPGGDPSQGMQQGMDPNAPPPPPPPVMSETPTPDTIANQISPAFLNDAAVLNDPQVFDAAAVATFAKPKALAEIFQNYGASLEDALDKLGRSLLLVYTQTRDIRAKLGDEAHRLLEQRIRDVFQGMGSALILLNNSSSQLSPSHNPSS